MANGQVIVALTKIDKTLVGLQSISLTNFTDNVNQPAIAAGSKIEIAGALFDVTADESISGWGGISNSSQVYIMLSVSGASFAASFTTTAPTWSTSKQGWYDVATGLNRYIGGCYKDGSGNFTKKFLFEDKGINSIIRFGDGTIGPAGLVVNAMLAAGAVSSGKIGWSMVDAGHVTLTNGQTYVLPAGIYMIGAAAAGYAFLLIYEEGQWNSTNAIGGAVFSDGTNVMLKAFGGGCTFYLKALV